MTGPELFLLVVGCYALAGVAFALAFVTVGVTRLDTAARGTSWRFLLLITPGSAALWPVLAVKWARAKGVHP